MHDGVVADAEKAARPLKERDVNKSCSCIDIFFSHWGSDDVIDEVD